MNAPPELLYNALLLGTPRLASKMTGRANPKYMDVPGRYTFSLKDMESHLDGRETYAVSLGLAGYAQSGCRDYDDADEAQQRSILQKAAALGLCAFLIQMPDNRCHLWALFAEAPVADIRAALRKLPGGKGEIYPSGSRIRLPFGYHKLKRTRGVLVLSDGRRFNLDADLDAAIAAVLELPRNPAPAAASEEERCADATWGEAYSPEHWQDLPDGVALLNSRRLAATAKVPHRAPELGAILKGERVTIAGDSTDSAQIASLVYHLMGAQYPACEVRAIALELKDQLRPGRGLDHYRAHVDAEIVRYTPKKYNPQPTLVMGSNVVTTSKPSRARKDRPQKVAGAAGYLTWLRTQTNCGSVMLSAQECADRVGCSLRTIRRYERELKAAGMIERRAYAQRQAGCLFLLERGDNIIDISHSDVVTGDPAVPLPVAPNASEKPTKDEHTRPVTLSELVAEALDALEQPQVDPTTGELRHRTAPRAQIRAWLAERWPDLDLDNLPAMLSQVRSERAAARAKDRSRAQWAGERLQAQQLDNAQLLAAVRGHASRMAAAEKKRPGSGYAKGCAVRFKIYDEERRRRGLSLEDAPPPKRGRAERQAGAARIVELARVFGKPDVVTRPETMQVEMLLTTFGLGEQGGCVPPLAPEPDSWLSVVVSRDRIIDPDGFLSQSSTDTSFSEFTGVPIEPEYSRPALYARLRQRLEPAMIHTTHSVGSHV